MQDLTGRLRRRFPHWFATDPGDAPPSAPLARAINAARASKGLPALVVDASLARLASSWAAAMASAGQLGHGDFAGRIATVYPNSAAAENVAAGPPDAGSAVLAWMDDPPHRANLLGDFDRMGVGAALDDSGGVYWCVDFARVG